MLLLHRPMADADVVAGVAAALAAGAVTAEAVAVEARKATDLRADVTTPLADGKTGIAAAPPAPSPPLAAAAGV